MIRTDDKSLCCGCQTCKIVCPQECISFKPDAIGSLYPYIDLDICISCGRCEAVCPIQKERVGRDIGRESFVAYAKNERVRFNGSSGGMFELIASEVISENGSVFACRFDSELHLRCVEASTHDEVRLLTKSKYLQSESADVFPTIRERIITGKKVLFCGTPCQVSALKNYLGNWADKENVWLIDFFCHGVPSQELFDKCKEYVEQTKQIKTKDFIFRAKKKNGATPHYYSKIFEKNGKEYKETKLYLYDPFYLGFQKYVTLRDSCYHCPFGSGNHVGDLTIGDFHDIDKYIKGINRFDGVSTVLVNTDKGQHIWEKIAKGCKVWSINIKTLFSDGQIYTGGTKEPKQRTEFLRDIEKMTFDEVVGKWFNSEAEWKKKLYYSLPSGIRKTLRQITGV